MLFSELALAFEERVVGDGEAMGFFVDAGDEAGDVGILGELSGAEAFGGRDDEFDGGRFAVVAGFVAANYGDSGAVVGVFEERQNSADLSLSAVEDDEVGKIPVGVFEPGAMTYWRLAVSLFCCFLSLNLRYSERSAAPLVKTTMLATTSWPDWWEMS